MVANRALEAARNGDIDTLRSVPEATNETDKHGATCLHYAARGGNVQTIEFLVKKKGFDAVQRSDVGATAAHDAAATGNLAALRWILENTECKVDEQDGTGATVLHLAARYGHTRVVKWLLDETNCDVMKKTSTGAMPLHFAVIGGNLELVKMLVKEAPRSVNLQMNNGVTSVYLAGQSGHLDLLQFLVLSANGSLKINSFDAMSVTQAAAQNGHLACVKWLVGEQKCNPNERSFDGASSLHFAASHGHYAVVDWLMTSGRARVTLDNLGGSPLHNAAEMGHKKCVEVLLKNGCDTSITDNKGLTAAELAEKCNQPECAALLNGDLEAVKPLPPLVTPSTSQAVQERLPQPPGFQVHRFPTRPSSVASSCSDFGYEFGHKAGKLITVQAEVYTQHSKDSSCLSLSKETGEAECVLSQDRHPSSLVYNARTRDSQGSELSSTASTLSSLSASASREFEDFDDGQEVHINISPPARVPFSTARALFEGGQICSGSPRSSSSEGGEKSSKSSQVPRNVVNRNTSSSKEMASPIETSQNGGVNKTVIQIRGSTIRIDDGTGSRDIKTHSKQNGSIPQPVKSNEPKLIMTVTPSNNEAPRSSNSSETKSSVSSSSSYGQTNGNTSPRNSSVINQSAPSTNSQTTSSVSNSNGSLNVNGVGNTNGHSVTTNKVPAKSPPISHPVYPGAVSPLASIMSSALPPKVAPASPPRSRQSHSPPPPPPQEDKTPSPTSTNVKPSSIVSGGGLRNGFVNPAPRFHGVKNDIIAELQSGAGKSGLKISKGPNKGTTMVFSFGGRSASNGVTGSKQNIATKAQDDEEFDPIHFLDKVPDTDASGQPIPQWKKPMMAKAIAEKVRKDTEERRKIEAEEARFRNVPAWKRALMEKKEAENRALHDLEKAPNAPSLDHQVPQYDEEGRPLTSWQAELRKKKGVVD